MSKGLNASLHDVRRPVANTGLQVSPLGLGTVKLGRDQGVKYPHGFTIPDDKSAIDLLALASDLGINFIDTAPAYGYSEERLGKLLGHRRRDWIICSKVGEEFENGESRFDFSPAHTRFSVERSLRRLNTDYLDMVLIHSDGNDLNILEQAGTLETLQELKREGLIRAVGLSGKTAEGGLLAAERADAVMLTYNLDYGDEAEVLNYCAQHGKAGIIKKAFASGHLVDTGADPVQASMDFIFAHAGTTSAIIGTINPDHLRQNVAAAVRAIRR